MKQIIQKYVLKNSLDYGGKANPKAVLGVVLKENPALKTNVPAILKEIEVIVIDVLSIINSFIVKSLFFCFILS